MRVTVKIIGIETFQIDIQPSDTVRHIKEHIQHLKDCKVEHQTILFQGKLLEDDSTVADCRIVERSILVVRVRDPDYIPEEEGIILDPLGTGDTTNALENLGSDIHNSQKKKKKKKKASLFYQPLSEGKENEEEEDDEYEDLSEDEANAEAATNPATQPQFEPMPIYVPPRANPKVPAQNFHLPNFPVPARTVDDGAAQPAAAEGRISEEEFNRRVDYMVNTLGFDRTQSATALRIENGNREAAIERLLANGRDGGDQVNDLAQRVGGFRLGGTHRLRGDVLFEIVPFEHRKKKNEEKKEEEKAEQTPSASASAGPTPEATQGEDEEDRGPEPVFRETAAGLTIQLTQRDKDDIEKIVSLTEVSTRQAAEAYCACNRSVELAINFLFNS
ncbi:putative Ubiquitin family [Monocercomonoides exilis]|uniref:putative Ubiquitin family n=1 Tax=Monocercomonoides exilis TaxID=2049356 RepID=UPI003559DBF4|nr:putative Ubiquitin family [Monocercomonoides exilis]|eukprot:MONOS_3118.1-p1 / transcript=MONOS_3118.1 / gene=MONOS_3118 / organism=Monocercomonoides_exilis_PA203 / gene_product=unspecified product / transcript_product=unspecified product / location=Mono_scaffold00070:111422-112778(+) / protein_length=388 / sequence_SO=supercontig / SO=protein_coding / is_pseudo=false